jgi:hypothetical protein
MKKIFSILLALVLMVLLTFGSCVGEENGSEPTIETWQPDVHGEVTFSQLDWMESPREALYPYSNVGVVEFAFLDGAGDWLLAEHGGGWLNVVINTSGTAAWSVQNLYLTYNDLDYLLASKPSVQFSLGLDNDTPIEVLEATVFLSSEPLEEQPETEAHSRYTVSHTPYLVGGGDLDWFGTLEAGSADSDIPLHIVSWFGTTFDPVRTACIFLPVADWAYIEEPNMGCFPGAAARSISYLSLINFWGLPYPQDLYAILYYLTDTDQNGCHNFAAGKLAFFEQYNLDVSDNVYKNIEYHPDDADAWNWEICVQQAQNALDNGCDVMMSLKWNGGGCHGVMVTCITLHMGGYTTISYVDDGQQGQNGGGNTVHVISTNHKGEFGGSYVSGFGCLCPES